MSGVVIGARCETVAATVASGDTTSSVVTVDGKIIVGIDLGATLTSTTLGLSNSVDGTTYRTAYDSTGAAISWTVAGARYLKFDPPLLGYKNIKLITGSSEGAARTLTVVMIP